MKEPEPNYTVGKIVFLKLWKIESSGGIKTPEARFQSQKEERMIFLVPNKTEQFPHFVANKPLIY